MSRFIFATAEDGKITLSVEMQPVGSATTADGLVGILEEIGYSRSDSIYCSSSIDFCEEEGFEPGAAGEMLEEAVEDFGEKVVDFYGS
jgi:hypothetical protein